MVPRVCLQFLIVVFPDHTHYFTVHVSVPRTLINPIYDSLHSEFHLSTVEIDVLHFMYARTQQVL